MLQFQWKKWQQQMRNNDIMDEDFDKDIDEPQYPMVDTPWALSILGVVITACFASVLIAATYRLDIWIIH